MKKSLTKKLKEAKTRIKELEDELGKVKSDRQIYRDRTVYMLKEIIRMHGANQYWKTDSQIEYIIKTLNKTENFYW